jgi:hypothetical protein
VEPQEIGDRHRGLGKIHRIALETRRTAQRNLRGASDTFQGPFRAVFTRDLRLERNPPADE